MSHYVCGFLFEYEGRNVALIRKNKPDWQEGKLNGIGGKIEEGETIGQAMSREFKEETGLSIADWKLFATIQHNGNTVYFLSAHRKSDEDIDSITDESVDWFDVNQVLKIGNIINSLKWLIPLALYSDCVVYGDDTKPFDKC